MREIEPVVNRARGHLAAAEWDLEQQNRMTPEERQRASRILKERAYGTACKDVREWHRGK